MAQKNEAEALANKSCIWNQQKISHEPISVREKSRNLNQTTEKNLKFFAYSPTLASTSPGPQHPETLPSTKIGMYRLTCGRPTPTMDMDRPTQRMQGVDYLAEPLGEGEA